MATLQSQIVLGRKSTDKAMRKWLLLGSVIFLLVSWAAIPCSMFAQTDVTDKSRSRRVTSQSPAPSPTPPVSKDENPQESDEVVRVETDLTSIFFTAADSSKRFIDTLKKEDMR